MLKHQHFIFILTFLLFSTNSLAEFSPLPSSDQNPFNLIHSQPSPVDAKITKPNKWSWSSSLNITNTLNSQNSSTQNLFLDYESYFLNTSLQYGVDKSWSIKIDIPLIYRGGGSFDSAINNWHNFFDLPQANRPNVANNQYRISLNQAGSSTVLTEPNLGIGDIQLSLARQIVNNTNTTLSFWGSIALPTGDADKLNGNDAIDVSTWLAINQGLNTDWFFNSNLGINLPALVAINGNDKHNSNLNDAVIFGHVMLAWKTTDWLDLKLQFEGHSSYYQNNSLRLLGSTYSTTFGGSIRINQCNKLDLAFTEDIKVEASADASFIISWRNSGEC